MYVNLTSIFCINYITHSDLWMAAALTPSRGHVNTLFTDGDEMLFHAMINLCTKYTFWPQNQFGIQFHSKVKINIYEHFNVVLIQFKLAINFNTVLNIKF
jgi:hypothetical protein